MIPVRDINPTRIRPYFTWGLIVLNALVFVFVWSRDGVVERGEFFGLGPVGQALLTRWGATPYFLLVEPSLGSWMTPLTSMFLHGGWLHLVGNMWFLHVFGDNVEDELGHSLYLTFYVLGGLAAVAVQAAIDPTSVRPMVGASGAVAAVLGAYMVVHPRAKVVTLTPIFLLMELPAYIFLFVWFGLQLFFALSSLHTGSSVAFFAHVGGFAVGALLITRFRRVRRAETGEHASG